MLNQSCTNPLIYQLPLTFKHFLLVPREGFQTPAGRDGQSVCQIEQNFTHLVEVEKINIIDRRKPKAHDQH